MKGMRLIRSRLRLDGAALTATQKTKLQDLAVRTRRPSKGVVALFTGHATDARTAAATAFANEVDLPLYRVDLGQLVSRYLGETEKNLERVFDAAKASGAILFLDEADALFGKRSEVKDSHDRYANVEVGYLLQRIEQHPGVVILATNLKSSLDPAFTRRLRSEVRFRRSRKTAYSR